VLLGRFFKIDPGPSPAVVEGMDAQVGGAVEGGRVWSFRFRFGPSRGVAADLVPAPPEPFVRVAERDGGAGPRVARELPEEGGRAVSSAKSGMKFHSARRGPNVYRSRAGQRPVRMRTLTFPVRDSKNNRDEIIRCSPRGHRSRGAASLRDASPDVLLPFPIGGRGESNLPHRQGRVASSLQ